MTSWRDEIRQFIEELIEHQPACDNWNCEKCKDAEAVYEAVQARLFSSIAYPVHIRKKTK